MIAALSAYPPAVWALLLATSVLIGLLAGLLGVGGGIVAVPVLLDVFSIMGLGEANGVVLAVGTAQASILVASLSAVVAHWRAGTIDGPLVRAWLPRFLQAPCWALALSILAPAKLLTGLFAGIAAALAVKMATGERLVLGRAPPAGLPGHLPPSVVGLLASAVGVGGGTLSTPVLSLFSFPIKRAIGAGALFNLVISAAGHAVFPDHRSRHARPDRRCAGRCGVVLRSGAVAACALCRARRGALVGPRAGLGVTPIVRALPRCRSPSACFCGPELALGQSGGIVFI